MRCIMEAEFLSPFKGGSPYYFREESPSYKGETISSSSSCTIKTTEVEESNVHEIDLENDDYGRGQFEEQRLEKKVSWVSKNILPHIKGSVNGCAHIVKTLSLFFHKGLDKLNKGFQSIKTIALSYFQEKKATDKSHKEKPSFIEPDFELKESIEKKIKDMDPFYLSENATDIIKYVNIIIKENLYSIYLYPLLNNLTTTISNCKILVNCCDELIKKENNPLEAIKLYNIKIFFKIRELEIQLKEESEERTKLDLSQEIEYYQNISFQISASSLTAYDCMRYAFEHDESRDLFPYVKSKENIEPHIEPESIKKEFGNTNSRYFNKTDDADDHPY